MQALRFPARNLNIKIEKRNTHDVSNYTIMAVDGEIGHVKDFIIEDQTAWTLPSQRKLGG